MTREKALRELILTYLQKKVTVNVTHLIEYTDAEKVVLDFIIENSFIYPEDMIRKHWRNIIYSMISKGYIEYNDVDSYYELTNKAYYSGYVQKAYYVKDNK